MQLDMVTIQRAFLDNVGTSEVLLRLPEHMKLNPLLCVWVSLMLESGSIGIFITPCGLTSWQV